MTTIINNATTGSIEITDLNRRILLSGSSLQVDTLVTNNVFTRDQLAKSDDLANLISTGSLEVELSGSVLEAGEGVHHIRRNRLKTQDTIMVRFRTRPGSAADDIEVYFKNAPRTFTIVDWTFVIENTGTFPNSIQLRRRKGGTGPTLSPLVDVSSAGTFRKTNGQLKNVQEGKSVIIRRTNRNMAGVLILQTAQLGNEGE